MPASSVARSLAGCVAPVARTFTDTSRGATSSRDLPRLLDDWRLQLFNETCDPAVEHRFVAVPSTDIFGMAQKSYAAN
jgi:hypothetical protein